MTTLRAAQPINHGLISGKSNRLISETSRLALELIKSSIEWVPEVKRPGREADHCVTLYAEAVSKSCNSACTVRLNTAHSQSELVITTLQEPAQ